MGVSTMHASNIKRKTFEFARALCPASCVDWAWSKAAWTLSAGSDLLGGKVSGGSIHAKRQNLEGVV